jgi:hypothetical protein
MEDEVTFDIGIVLNAINVSPVRMCLKLAHVSVCGAREAEVADVGSTVAKLKCSALAHVPIEWTGKENAGRMSKGRRKCFPKVSALSFGSSGRLLRLGLINVFRC